MNIKWHHVLLIAVGFLCSACEYGDVHGKPESFDRLIGLKSQATEVLALRKGKTDFMGFFVFQFPENTSSFFASPPAAFFDHPVPLSYERNKVFVKWKKTPVHREQYYLIEQALDRALSIGLDHDRYHSLLALAKSRSAYYAASFKDDRLGIHNLDLYFLDPQKRMLYCYTDSNFLYVPEASQEGRDRRTEHE